MKRRYNTTNARIEGRYPAGTQRARLEAVRLFEFALGSVICILLLFPDPSFAGAPVLTDDPDPTDHEHWEFDLFSQVTHADGTTVGSAPAVEANYGIVPSVQLHLLGQLALNKIKGEGLDSGFGDMELAAKYQFLDEDDSPLGLRAAIAPQVNPPTGDEDRGLGAGKAQLFAPLWLGKAFGDWSTYGGGGLWQARGGESQDYWFFGWALQRACTDRLMLGGELFYQTASQKDGADTSGFNFGGIFDFTDNHHLLASAGRGLSHAPTTNEFSYYLGYQLTF